MFSCLISCYRNDNPLQLKEALNSLVRQSLPAQEIVLVEDGKLTEDLYSIIDVYSELLPIKRIPLLTNEGLGNALNIGLQNCSYEIVLRMDADDVCHPERFRKQVRFLQDHPEISVVGTWAHDIDENGDIVGSRIYPTRHEELIRIIWTCPFAHPTIAYRKADILRVGSYRTDIKRRQDYDLWMRAAANGLRFANIPEHLLYYRFTDSYYSKNNIKVAWSQALMGLHGLRLLKTRRFMPYIGVFFPVVRAVFPNVIEKHVHRLLSHWDPRRRMTLKDN